MKLNWGFGIAAAYITFVVCMILFVIKASREQYDLVADNYYEQAVDYQQRIDAEQNYSNARSHLAVDYIAEKNVVQITTSDEVNNLEGVLSFYKPDKASHDFRQQFAISDDSITIVSLKKLSRGNWTINVEWMEAEKNCFLSKQIFIK